MIIEQKSHFKKAMKKLSSKQREVMEDAIREIMADPSIGEKKKGELAAVRVYKFKMSSQLILLAYTHIPNRITLLAFGSHENFYRDLKKTH